MSITLVLLALLFFVTAATFILGYYMGTRAKAQGRQPGFPIQPAWGDQNS